jgi:hypothetical protein
MDRQWSGKSEVIVIQKEARRGILPRVMLETFPAATVPGTQHDVDFMVKGSKRFADSGGWGWAVFDYDAASDTFTPGTLAGKPRRGTTPSAGSLAPRP